MPDSSAMTEAFRRLLKVFEQLRVTGAQKMGQSNMALLVSLTYRQGRALMFIAEGEKTTGDGIHQIDLARALATTVPATSVLVDVLVKKKLVKRFPSPNDRRSLCLRLTSYGQEVYETSQKNLRDLTNDLTGELSEEDREAFIRVVDHFYQKIYL